MTDFITHYYTISVFSSTNKKKVQKKKLFEGKKNTPLKNKWLNFKKEFWCQDTTFAEFASLVQTLPVFDI